MSHECQHLFSQGRCEFRRTARMPAVDLGSNFGGIDPRAGRPAWMDASHHHLPAPRWQDRLRFWFSMLLTSLAARLAARESPVGLPAFQGRSWMASEAMALGSADIFDLADDFVRPREALRFRR
jgi:hypothetical protein